MFTDLTADNFVLCEKQQQQRQNKCQHGKFHLGIFLYLSQLTSVCGRVENI